MAEKDKAKDKNDKAAKDKNDKAVKDKNVIERALEGSISSNDFRSFIPVFIRDQNTLALKSTETSISKNMLDFNMEGSLLPVVDFDEKKYQTDVVTLFNNSKKNKVYFEIFCKPNPKFELLFNPSSGEIKKGTKIDITFQLRVFCTTKVYQMLKITIYKKKPKESKGTLRDNKKEDELGSLHTCFKIESLLSSVIDYDEIQMSEKPLARGGYGTVYKATWRNSNVAVKVLNTQDLVESEKEAVKREIKLMNTLNHQYIVTYMGSTQIPGQPLCIIMEFIPGGSLTDLLGKGPISDKFKCKLALDVATGMAFLHSNSIYHRDLKPDNMLVVSSHPSTPVNLKITDFGTSRVAAKKNVQGGNYLSFQDAQTSIKQDESTPRTFTKGVGTLIYQAPEILMGKSDYAIDKTDIFSFAMLLWQVFTQKEPYLDEPYKHFTKFEIIEFVTSGKRIPIPKEIHPKISAMIQACWDHKPENRPDFTKIVRDLSDIYNIIPEPEEQNRGSFSVPGLGDPADIASIGYSGTISRNQAEEKLKGCEIGTFLVRWSHNTSSYVLSYITGPNQYQHIAYIKPDKDNGITVDKQDGTSSKYENLKAYIEAMKSSGIIKKAWTLQGTEDLYDRSPSVYAKTETKK